MMLTITRSPEATDPWKFCHHPREDPDRLKGAFPLALDDVHVGLRAASYKRGREGEDEQYHRRSGGLIYYPSSSSHE